MYVSRELLEGWISAVAAVNPVTFILEAGRSFIAGQPDGGAMAFGIGIVLILLFIPWALFGLRSAERAG